MREMKDSGIDIVKDIPKEWSVIRLKYLCNIQTGNQDTQDADEDGEYNFYVRSPIIEKSNHYTFEGEGILMAGDGAGAGRIFHHAFGKYAVHQRVYRLSQFLNINSFYLFYYLSNLFNVEMDKGSAQSTVPSVRLPMLLNFRICIPPKEVQDRIADFLEAKCNEFHSLISDIQQQIETLEEYKKSLVFHVVSTGIKSTTLKETVSNVWTKIPQNWKLVDIKYVFEIVKRIAGQEGFDVLSVTQKGLKIKDIESNNGQQAESYSGYQFVYPTDYVMNHMDLLTGWVDCSTMFGVTSPDYRVFRLYDKENNDLTYFKYVMQCCYMSRIFYSLGQGVSNLGRWRLQTTAFNNFMIPVPPFDEQKEIAQYLDKKISEIDTIIADKQQQIKTIEEYKKALIFEYVTGKKEVNYG